MNLKGKMRMFIVFMCVITFLLVACQPTPQNEIVINKNNGELEEKIKNTSEVTETELNTTEGVENKDNYMNTGMEANGIVNEVFDNGKNIIDINAEISKPIAPSLPVAIVAKSQITQNDANKIIQHFFGNAELKSAGNNKNESNIIEDFIIPKISELKRNISNVENYDNLTDEEKQKIDNEVKAFFASKNAYLEYLKQALEVNQQALEDEKKYAAQQSTQIPKEEININTDIEQGSIDVAAETEQGITSSISISNSEQGTSVQYKKNINMGYLDITFLGKKVENEVGLENEVVEKVGNLFEQLNLEFLDFDEYVIDDSYELKFSEQFESSPSLYRVIIFNKAIEDVPITNGTTIDSMIPSLTHSEVSNQVFALKANPPQISVCINENGEIITLNIDNPIKVVEIENPNIEIINTEEAIKIFKEKMKLKDYVGTKEDNARIIINEIRLSLCMVAKKDDINFIRALPVYDFIGYGYKGDSKEVNENKPEDAVILTINAIDGSIIDRHLGY